MNKPPCIQPRAFLAAKRAHYPTREFWQIRLRGSEKKIRKDAPFTELSIEVRFFLRRADSSCASVESDCWFGVKYRSASSSQRSRIGFSLHMFLKLKKWIKKLKEIEKLYLRLRASKREIVVWEKSLPYSRPIATPTSPCVKPSLIRFCLNSFANLSSSSS